MFTIKIADSDERETIYRLRYVIYATELKQHRENSQERLMDGLDEYNTYIVIKEDQNIAGFISITPPGKKYSLDKYIDRNDYPGLFENMYEGRLLSVLPPYRGSFCSLLLFYSAFRYVEEKKGDRIAAIGRSDLLSFYKKAGLSDLNRQIHSGEVTFNLFYGELNDIRGKISLYERMIEKLAPRIQWLADFPLFKNEKYHSHFDKKCFHGGCYINNSAEILSDPKKLDQVINADVLDAWFNPSPKAVKILKDNLNSLIKTSPPVYANQIENKLSQKYEVNRAALLTGAGSSDLIFRSFPILLDATSKVLILDPAYGEYNHILKEVINCHVEQLPLEEKNTFKIEKELLLKKLDRNYQMVILVNPNNPTGHLFNQNDLKEIIDNCKKETLFWIDETYIDFVDRSQSLQYMAADYPNLIICKSLSKILGFSGIRAAYMCAHEKIIHWIKKHTPPWHLSHLAQIALWHALDDDAYYEKMRQITCANREWMVKQLQHIEGIQVVSGAANFILCKVLSENSAAEIIGRCAKEGVFLRNVENMGSNFNNKYIRITIKDEASNQIIIDTLNRALTL